MFKHYHKKRLINPNNQTPLSLTNSSVWELSPYQIAKFGGELAQVMLEALEQHIYQKCLSRQQQIFHKTAFSDSTVASKHESEKH
ncbi:MAG TPA: hypothetical protein PLZ08_06370 [Bacillota bacterium]|jgi:hypothetical protein|nr:hypothetical protein [Bacillota bacterium]HOL09872.1 hypothetical protein [Bacillota bacterium]HPO97568.1 hypothetical protein [Bacillota bacterium]